MATRVEQPIDALANRQLALLAVALEILGAAPQAGEGLSLAELGDERRKSLEVRAVLGAVGSNAGLEDVHRVEDLKAVQCAAATDVTSRNNRS